MAKARSPEEELEVPESTPEFYVDSVHVGTQLYGSTMWLGALRSGKPPLVKVIVKMSPQMLKVTSLILSKHVRDYERDLGPIALPNRLLHSLGLEEFIQ